MLNLMQFNPTIYLVEHWTTPKLKVFSGAEWRESNLLFV